jgi:hypothetical protein
MEILFAEPTVADELPSHAVTGVSPAIFSAIHDPATNIVIWQRSRPAGLESLKLDQICDIRFTSPIATLPDTVEREIAKAGFRSRLAPHSLATDILTLANHFSAVMNISMVEIRLEHITTNACHKYHADWVTARLITTYFGQGTQWLSQNDALRHAEGAPLDALHHHSIKTGEVALFKGRLWSNDAPAIHRSPPIEGTGEERLMLVINPGRQSPEE